MTVNDMSEVNMDADLVRNGARLRVIVETIGRRLKRPNRRCQAAIRRSVAMSLRGGAPNIRAYSRLNCDGLS